MKVMNEIITIHHFYFLIQAIILLYIFKILPWELVYHVTLKENLGMVVVKEHVQVG